MEGTGIKSKQTVWKVIAYLNICILWGASTVFTKMGLSGIPPIQFASLRFGLAGILLLATALLRGDRPKLTGRDWRTLALIGLLLNFLTNGCIMAGSMMTSASIVTLIMAATPVFAAIFEVFLKKTALGRRKLLGLAVGFVGILIVVLCGGGDVRANMDGVQIVLLGVLCWTAGSIYAKGRTLPGSVFFQAGTEALMTSMLFFLLSQVTGTISLSQITPAAWTPVIYLAVCDSVIGFASYTYLLKVMPASTVCTYAYVNPVIALILGRLLLDESILPGKILGMALVIGAVVLIQRDSVE